MLKVFKYDISINDYFTVNLPQGAQVLKVEEQYGKPQLWALVDPNAPQGERTFRFVGTGHPINDAIEQLKFINTFQMKNGALIFHIFEVINAFGDNN